MDKKINNMKAGDSIELSSINGRSVRAERSGKGDILRIFRVERNGSWSLIKKCGFNER